MITEPTPPIRNPKVQRPQREWGWEIAIYLYMAGMGAGSFVVGSSQP
jgi:formate-dependent nitrite reductase membrane component NrfD